MSDTPRKILGIILGALMGLAYSLVSLTVNTLALPNLPLYHSGPGLFASILMITLFSGILGLAAAWTEETIPGIILSSLIGVALSTSYIIFNTPSGTSLMAQSFAVLFITFLPRAFLFVPVAVLIRWIINLWENELRSASYSLTRLVVSAAVLVVAAGGAGAFSLYPPTAREALKATNTLVQQGMQANSSDALPQELYRVDGFQQAAHGPYSLELSDNPDLLPVQRPVASYNAEEYAVFVHFENGFRFGCAFTPPANKLSCGLY